MGHNTKLTLTTSATVKVTRKDGSVEIYHSKDHKVMIDNKIRQYLRRVGLLPKRKTGFKG